MFDELRVSFGADRFLMRIILAPPQTLDLESFMHLRSLEPLSNVVEEHYNSNKDMHTGGKVYILVEDHFMHQPPMFKTPEAMKFKPST
ncbi:uncharacterized protein Bfra_005749 [Botrytis fragariae]|uniref:Uncharacterized protein n=1 Tax=Botrytis fragariae TaxID=1964551 RepID=A0A8H6AS48_9HELO|nr:uncharacterized protein Bfra_005749 [Botrytis fragariae]KAF5872390.1 hypothetical protein Bfra_005749 [Botrytis fragariae]